MEQALALPYATLRFVHLGWRVIRVEALGSGKGLPGDPNRYIGARSGANGEGGDRDNGDDRRSYFIAPNVGKEAIALNLKTAEGRAVLQRLVQALEVDVFCCNTVPERYAPLGIDYATLATAKPDLIWAGISAMGPEYPSVPGYDPVIQALAGYMELTGDPAGPPTLCGIPLIDLKAGDEVYANVLLALAERAESGIGREIHVSMLQAAASWLITTLPLLDFDCEPWEVTRAGNEHRKFVPTNVYPTRDGFIFMAVGSDAQWKRLTEIPKFAALDDAVRITNEGRVREREAIHRDMAAVTRQFVTAQIAEDFGKASIPHARIHDIPAVREMQAVRGKLTTTRMPGGKTVRMQPMAVDVRGAPTNLRFAPKYGQDTWKVLRETGCSEADCAALKQEGVIAG